MAELIRQPPPPVALDGRVERLECRLARIEAHLGLIVAGEVDQTTEAVAAEPAAAAITPADLASHGDELERQVSENGFAVAGIVALTIGSGYMLTLPYPNLPPVLPSAVGMGLVAGLLLAARAARRQFGSLVPYVQGGAMVLLLVATLRLHFFGTRPAIDLANPAGCLPLVLAVAVNAALAWWRRSPWLAGLALMTGCAAALAVGTGGFLLVTLPVLAAGVVAAARWGGWPVLPLAGIPLLYTTYFTWAIGNPLRGGRFHYVGSPDLAPGVLLVLATLFAAGALLRPHRDHEDATTNTSALLNCVLGYAVFLIHTAAAFPRSFVFLHGLACAVFLSLAVLFWSRERSQVSTFFYALTGYGALSMVILKAAPVPEVFVWLSLQSVLVVTTALWFRSRLIVVANFLIYVAIVLGYMFVAERETGISIGFGLVALASAWTLHWQQHRLELKTVLMRNAYLLSAFVVFPYALHHLVPLPYVALSWIGLAAVYYGLNALVPSRQHRWMGHATLALAAIFLLLPGPGRLGPELRVASFLALGTVMLLVSLSFTRARR